VEYDRNAAKGLDHILDKVMIGVVLLLAVVALVFFVL